MHYDVMVTAQDPGALYDQASGCHRWKSLAVAWEDRIMGGVVTHVMTQSEETHVFVTVLLGPECRAQPGQYMTSRRP